MGAQVFEETLKKWGGHAFEYLSLRDYVAHPGCYGQKLEVCRAPDIHKVTRKIRYAPHHRS